VLEDIDRIEVISGPGGTLWGANAVNGVINITTKSAKDTQGGFLEAGGGSGLEAITSVRYGGTLAPNVYFRVYGKYSEHESGVITDGTSADDAWHMSRGGFRIDSEALPQNTLTLQGDLYSGDDDQTAGGTTHESGGNVLGRWSHTFAPDSDMSLQLYYDTTHIADPKPGSGAVASGTLTDDLDTYDLDFQHHFRAGESNGIIWGLGYRFTHDEVGNAPSVAFLPSQLDRNLFNVFVQDEIKLAETLTFTIGTKLEHNDYTGFEWEPPFALEFPAHPNALDGGFAGGALALAH
jgi:iron complex outermembrane recepter protein